MSGFIDNENENRVGTAGNLEQLRLNCKKERKIGIEKDRERKSERIEESSAHTMKLNFLIKSANSSRSPIARKMRHSESSPDKDTATATEIQIQLPIHECKEFRYICRLRESKLADTNSRQFFMFCGLGNWLGQQQQQLQRNGLACSPRRSV